MGSGSSLIKHFTATLETLPSLGWTIAHVPFAPAEAWPKRVRLRVLGTIAGGKDSKGIPFRTSLFPYEGGGYFVLVSKELQQASGVRLGEIASLTLQPDLEPRPAELPDELAPLLDEEPGLRTYYDALTEYTRREIGKWVQDVKSDEARLRRARQMAERLFATMEAERELPPIVARAFRQRPRAADGWQKMTPTQRRMELFAVTYYQTPEAQAKRVTRLCDAAEKKAGRK